MAIDDEVNAIRLLVFMKLAVNSAPSEQKKSDLEPSGSF